MREKDLENRIKLIHDRLDLINLYLEEFLEKLGSSGTEQLVNENLEELKELLVLLAKIAAQKNKEDEK